MSDDNDDLETTGPFCRHWSDPVECEIRCQACGCRCMDHWMGDVTECQECDCSEWVEPES